MAFSAGSIRWIVVSLFFAAAGWGCAESPECERLRLKTHRTWAQMQGAALERKNANVDEQNWGLAEKKSDTLQSAFATSQITWDSAEKAKQELTDLAKALSTDNEIKMEVYRASLAEAVAQQEAYKAQCK